MSKLYDMGLDIDHSKSRYSLSYFASVCAQAGAAMDETRQDEDVWAVDAKVELNVGDVRVQLKCTESPKVTAKGIRIDLEQEWIDKWKHKKLPTYIVGVVVPKEKINWIHYHGTAIIHMTQAYWQRFDPKSTKKSITLPRENRLTPDTLTAWDLDLTKSLGAIQ